MRVYRIHDEVGGVDDKEGSTSLLDLYNSLYLSIGVSSVGNFRTSHILRPQIVLERFPDRARRS